MKVQSCALPVACLLLLGACSKGAEGTWADPTQLKADANGVYRLAMRPSKVQLDGSSYCLRTYGGVLAPLIRIPAATTPRRIRVDLLNGMTTHDAKPVSGSSCMETAVTHHFNRTNLHTHGLHVSPERTLDGSFASDDVLLEVDPGAAMSYRFDIDEPQLHPAGTFWFHPHLHGSTAIQVANGVAGALIVEGDVDRLPGIKEARERVFLFQQIPFDSVQPLVGDCTDSTLSIDDFPLAIAAKRTLTNGILAPTIVVSAGEVERWRFIHAGISQELALTFRKRDGSACGGTTDGSSAAFPLRQIAADGLTFAAAEALDTLVLEPGYRADAMMQAPSEPGFYCLMDATQAQGLNGPEGANVVAVLEVVDRPISHNATLPTDAALASVARAVLDCNSTLVRPVRPMVFAQQKDSITQALCEGQCPVGTPIFNVDCRQFNHADPPATLPFGEVEEWHLSSELSDHPFHIHVNPFTVCPGSVVRGVSTTVPHWKDTLFVRQADTSTGSGVNALTSSPIRIRTEYEDFRGKFVMHCHKLQHEDEGMMRLLDVE